MRPLTSTDGWIRFIAAAALAFGINGASASTVLAGPGMSATGPAITLKQPALPKSGKNEFEVIVKNANGKPIDDAEVSVQLVMPKSGAMAEMRDQLQLRSAGNGTYTGSGDLAMRGKWKVTVTAKQHGKTIATKRGTLSAS